MRKRLFDKRRRQQRDYAKSLDRKMYTEVLGLVVAVALLVHLAVLASAHLDLAVALVSLPVAITRHSVPLHVDRGREVGNVLRAEREGLFCQLQHCMPA